MALRAPLLGNPVLHVDEQFYLLVGDRMLHGALPYVDIWDRKPIGLFLLFAGFRLLGGDGVWCYQIAAIASVTATAYVIYRIARQIAAPAGAFWAGLAYILCLSGYNCFGGQSPVYYNLPVALVGLLLSRTLTTSGSPQLLRNGLLAMALIGLSIQLKYTVIFEGGAMGLALIWRARADGWGWPRLLAAWASWISMAVLPTALALGYYAALGHGPAFVHANFLSIFGRQEVFSESLWRLTKETICLIPIWLAIFLAPRRLPPAVGSNLAALPLLKAWALVAVLGFLVFGTWYDHYVAPVLVPLCIIAAPALGRPRKQGLWYTVVLIGFGTLAAAGVITFNVTEHGFRPDITRTTALIQPHIGTGTGTGTGTGKPPGNGCLYISDGDPILYMTTNSCLVSSYIFSSHLSSMVDVAALGIDVNAEMQRIMAAQPSVVMIPTVAQSLPVNWASRGIMQKALAQDYVRFAITKIGTREFQLYRLKPQTPPRPAEQ